jgi:hypothetical protein
VDVQIDEHQINWGREDRPSNTGVCEMSEKIISRREAFSLLGLAAALGFALPAEVLTSPEANAQAQTTAPAPSTPQTGTERRQERRTERTEERQERRTGRTERRHERRARRRKRREERRAGRHERREERRSGREERREIRRGGGEATPKQ